jgi:hypothetical protein
MRFRVLAFLAAVALSASAQQHDPSVHGQHASADASGRGAPPGDARVAVRFPDALREQTLANMRDHLLGLQEILTALSKQDYDRAAGVAEQRLGMSSLARHGAHEVAKYMPSGMQDAGTAMHHGASRFAIAARDAAATGDVKPALAALAEVVAACSACHAGYRLR